MANTVAKYQKYAEYQDSGIEWLGDIPKHWQTVSLKMLIDVRDGTHDTPPYVEPNFNTYPLVTSKDVTGGRVDLSNCKHISELDYSNIIKRSGVSKGDILMPMIGTVGSPVLVEDKFEIAIKNLALFKTSIGNEKLDSKFLFYFLNSTECETQFSLEGKGGVQNFVSLGTLRNLVLPLTKTSEQIKIANFLDHETTKIDHLIEKQQQLIELLREKRQAVISHAVTKGLDPNIPMKYSGVEWLGEVPEHWTVSKLKYIKSHEQNAFVDGPFGSNLKSEHFVEDGDVYVIESNFATTGNLETSNLKRITTKHFETICRSEAKGGDIIIAKIGARFGSSSILPILDKKAVVSGNSLKLTVNCKICDVNYANKLLQHLKNEGAIDDGVNGSAQPALSLGGLNTLPFLLPPLDEQIKIIQSLDLKVSKIDQVISQAKKQILLMQERRTALISAAVTGKIDVRNWQSPTVAETHTELSA